MLKIGEFSKLTKTTVKTLRFYDEVGLLNPVFVDDNGYRYYEISQLNDIIKIIELRNLDISIKDIKEILSSNNKSQILENHLCNLEKAFHRKKQQISLIRQYIKKAKKGDFMENYQANEIEVPENIVYFKHGIIDSMANLFDFVISAGEEAKKLNPTLKCKNYCYVSYTEKEYKEKDIELEYVEAVNDYGKESENIHFRKDPSIKAISVKHKGDYANLPKAYAFALNWIKEKNYVISGTIREVYIDGCWNKQSSSEYLTEIQIPIK